MKTHAGLALMALMGLALLTSGAAEARGGRGSEPPKLQEKVGPTLGVEIVCAGHVGPIDATVTIKDALGYATRPKTVTREANANGVARFSPRDFKGWFIHPGIQYHGKSPWDWVAVRSRVKSVREGTRNGQYHKHVEWTEPTLASFKVEVVVSAQGHPLVNRMVDLRDPRETMTVNLTPRSQRPRRRPRPSVEEAPVVRTRSLPAAPPTRPSKSRAQARSGAALRGLELVFQETFDDNRDWSFNGRYRRPNFDDYPGVGGWDNGPAIYPARAGHLAYVDIVDGMVRGCSVGYGKEPQAFEPADLHQRVDIDISRGFRLEFRAKSEASWPNRAVVYLISDWRRGTRNKRYYGLRIFGESSNHAIDLLSGLRNEPGEIYHRLNAGPTVNAWHVYALTRDANGRFRLEIDGQPVRGFRPDPDTTLTHVSRIAINTARRGSAIDWVRVYVPPKPERQHTAGLCPECGRRVALEDNFCSQCGRGLRSR